MSQTKDKIIVAAIQLFNEQGFVNVRLQNIADELSISVGNLAYHFKNKEAIVAEANEQVGEQFKNILSSYRTYPDLRDLDHQLDYYYSFIKKYPFYFIDIIELKRNYPHLHEERKEYISKMKVQFDKRIEFKQHRGTINIEMAPQQICRLVDNICTTISFWYTSKTIKDEQKDLISFKQAIWIQLFPFLTNKGREEYERYITPEQSVI